MKDMILQTEERGLWSMKRLDAKLQNEKNKQQNTSEDEGLTLLKKPKQIKPSATPSVTVGLSNFLARCAGIQNPKVIIPITAVH